MCTAQHLGMAHALQVSFTCLISSGFSAESLPLVAASIVRLFGVTWSVLAGGGASASTLGGLVAFWATFLGALAPRVTLERCDGISAWMFGSSPARIRLYMCAMPSTPGGRLPVTSLSGPIAK